MSRHRLVSTLGPLVLGLALVLPTLAHADETTVIRELTAVSSIRPEIRLADGFPRSVRVDVPVQGADPAARARDFLGRFAPLYGLVDPSAELVVERVQTDGRMNHVRFVQRHEGLQVDGGELVVHLSGDRVIGTNGQWASGLGPLPASRIGADEATRLAIEVSGLREPGVLGRPRQIVVPVEGRAGTETRAGWRVQLLAGTDRGPVQLAITIDAADGAILAEETRTAESLDLQIDTASNQTTTSCWDDELTEWFDEDGDNSDYDPSSDAFDDGLDLWNQAFDIYDWFDTEVGHTSFDDDDGEIETVVHVGMNWNNASQVPGCDQIWFGDGSAQLDVFAHELTHAIDNEFGNLAYQLQSGALDESFADVFGVLVDGGDYLVGEDLEGWGGGCNGTNALRDFANPAGCGQPDHFSNFVSLPPGQLPNCGTGGNDCGNVHTNSGIPNKAAWLLMEGGLHTGFQVDKIGRDKVAQLYRDVLVYSVTSDTQFVDARDDLVSMASMYSMFGFYGFTDHDVCQVKNAFAAVGIATGSGDSDCDGIANTTETDNDGDFEPDSTDNCDQIPNPGQWDSDGDGIGNACDTDDDDDGVLDGPDNCDTTANGDQKDKDGDGKGDVCDDSDFDGIFDPFDNCPTVANHDQSNIDGDSKGDACDTDMDGDGVPNDKDVCEEVADDQSDSDGDKVGDACDNCVDTPNDDQADCDGDGQGDACDPPTLFELLECNPIEVPREMHEWVHPLDLVSLPMCDGCTVLPEGWTVNIYATVSDGTPVRIIDDLGNHVAWVGRDGASFQPVASARFTAGREVGSFRSYFLEVGPSVSGRDDLEMDLAIETGPQ